MCNDETNNPECYYDGGDCCGSCRVTDLCTNCTCIGIGSSNPEVINPLIGNGFCNDETNNALCGYDGMDCCQSPANTTFCSECSCKGKFFLLNMICHPHRIEFDLAFTKVFLDRSISTKRVLMGVSLENNFL